MTTPTILELQYPIGKFTAPTAFSQSLIDNYIQIISSFPEKIRIAVSGLSDAQLETPYRPDGWTITQLVNHCSDGHMNGFLRLKLALTEETPTAKAFNQTSWAELADSKNFPVDAALQIIAGVHTRWTAVLRAMTQEDFNRGFIHPSSGNEVSLFVNTGQYAWHCEHHLAHINGLKTRMGW